MTDDLTPGQILELRERALEHLSSIPGVCGVGYGLKEVGDKPTDRVALRVYVEAKKPLDELPPDEVLPQEFEGVPVDVVVVSKTYDAGTQDTQHHSPLIGGISITNRKPASAGGFELGTLGFFATQDGVSGPKNVVLLTNNHVLAANAGAVGDTTYQPRLTSGGLIDSEFLGAIATVNNMGIKAPHSFAYPSQPSVDYYLDCAISLLSIDISSWCDCNCGVSYKNELREITTATGSTNSKLEGVAGPEALVVGKEVFKTGALTGATKGTILDPIGTSNHEGSMVHNIVIILPDQTVNHAFSDHGDSGSIVIDGDNKVLALLFGGSPVTDPSPRSVASHIAPVLDLLKVTPISTQNPPVGPAGHARSNRLARVGSSATSVEDHTVELQERLRRTPSGAALHAAFLEHRSEVVGLVNRHRPTTIAWHRGKGPTFFAHLAENARHPEHRIPVEVEGVTRGELLERMEETLMAHGSEPLRAAIAEHREAVLALVDDFDDLHELVGRFEESTAHV